MKNTNKKCEPKHSEDKIKHIISNSRTIAEKRSFYTENQAVDVEHLNKWRDVNTLLNDNYFKKMLTVENMTTEEFGYTLQPNNDITYRGSVRKMRNPYVKAN